MADSKDTQIVMQVPQEVIRAQVQSAVAQALAKNPGELIRACVETAMRQPAVDRYGQRINDVTVWEQTVNNMIRDLATEEFKAWLAEQAPAIRKAVRAKLEQRRGSYFDKCVDALTEAMSKNFNVSIYVKGD